jgi:predicted small secreted protein
MNANSLSFNRSLLLEPRVLTLQRESENYIRLLEQEKKHYYNVDETWVLVKKEWNEKRVKLEEVYIGNLYELIDGEGETIA